MRHAGKSTHRCSSAWKGDVGFEMSWVCFCFLLKSHSGAYPAFTLLPRNAGGENEGAWKIQPLSGWTKGKRACFALIFKSLYFGEGVFLAAELLHFNRRIPALLGDNNCVGTRYNSTSIKDRENRGAKHF